MLSEDVVLNLVDLPFLVSDLFPSIEEQNKIGTIVGLQLPLVVQDLIFGQGEKGLAMVNLDRIEVQCSKVTIFNK